METCILCQVIERKYRSIVALLLPAQLYMIVFHLTLPKETFFYYKIVT